MSVGTALPERRTQIVFVTLCERKGTEKHSSRAETPKNDDDLTCQQRVYWF